MRPWCWRSPRQFPDTTQPPPYEGLIGRAINGLSWPDTECLHYALGDTVRWRWINASADRHPMHLLRHRDRQSCLAVPPLILVT